MGRVYTTTLDLSIGGDEPSWEGEATVAFTVAWGAPEVGPTYSHGGLPADPDLVEDITVTHIDGAVVVGEGLKAMAEDLEDHITTNDRLVEQLLIFAVEAEADAHHAAQEARWEDRRLGDY